MSSCGRTPIPPFFVTITCLNTSTRPPGLKGQGICLCTSIFKLKDFCLMCSCGRKPIPPIFITNTCLNTSYAPLLRNSRLEDFCLMSSYGITPIHPIFVTITCLNTSTRPPGRRLNAYALVLRYSNLEDFCLVSSCGLSPPCRRRTPLMTSGTDGDISVSKNSMEMPFGRLLWDYILGSQLGG